MMHRDPVIVLRRERQQREIHDPQEIELILRRRHQPQQFRAAQPHPAQHFAHRFQLHIRAKEEHVAFDKTHPLTQRRLFRVAEKLHDRRLPLPADRPLDIRQPLRAEFRLHPLLPFLELLLAQQRRRTLRVQRLDHPAAIHHRTEHLELRLPENVRQLHQLQPEAGVRLVAAIAVHRLAIRHPRKRHRDLHPARLAKNPRQQPLDQRLNLHLRDERRLHIDLRELRLPVRPQILIAKTPRDLEILLQPRHLQQLLVLLRRLRQRVKRTRRQPRRHQEIPRALRRRIRQDRRLDFQKPRVIQIIPHRLHHPMPQPQIALHPPRPQIQIAVLQPQILIHARVIQRERRHVRLVQHLQLARDDLHRPRRQLRIFAPHQPRRHHARELDHILTPQPVRRLRHLRMLLRPENHLRQTLAVPQVDEDHPTMIPP